mmetsp:Transcript_6961/g.12037  ORF Transcript_6961/g.12037 Transcript_6961/m.12037 type:complete len:255 (+) Transcript_6961:136-900(+)|eukprot:CAMPEP_0198212606 /NCGR_PEP_ID=MMETSP1445-20131203/26795_1 /TAXON_ID=36898 /ORGANISM="Pyramimonas sp., Strain CCMP2087" /LENGTH=254 /DNA_ID=CAMNT_0043887099 /DNA_START=115 /DNA_END=879 /DNA_ORIENTATION=+
MTSIIVNAPVNACLNASRHNASRSFGSSSSAIPGIAVAHVRLSAASVSLGAASHRQRLQIVAQAKGGKKKVKSPPAPKTGFGAAATVSTKREPEQLDVKTVESYAMFNLCVRASAEAMWCQLGKMVVEDPATIGAAMNERRALLKSTANGMPQIMLATKGVMDGVQYGAQELVPKKEGEEEKEGEKEEEKPIVMIPLGGKIEVRDQVKALINVSNGLSPPSGSIWSRNQELYGGNTVLPMPTTGRAPSDPKTGK